MTVICITRTHSRILFALEAEGRLSPSEIAEFWRMKRHDWIGRNCRELLDAGIIRVAKWRRSTDGNAAPIYAIGNGPKVPRPKREGWAVWSKRYRQKVKAEGGVQVVKARNSLALLVGITSRAAQQ